MGDIFRREYRELSDREKDTLTGIKSIAEDLHDLFGEKENREMSLAKTKLEEAVMWAVKGITG